MASVTFSVVMPSVTLFKVILNAVIPSAIILSVAAP